MQAGPNIGGERRNASKSNESLPLDHERLTKKVWKLRFAGDPTIRLG
jgi:hypothetical protein